MKTYVQSSDNFAGTALQEPYSETHVYPELIKTHLTDKGLTAEVLNVETTLNTYAEHSTARVVIYSYDRNFGILAFKSSSNIPGQHQQLMRAALDAFMHSNTKTLLCVSYGVLCAPIGHLL